jgi:drug/metabolite transporter (DMT)-like permease
MLFIILLIILFSFLDFLGSDNFRLFSKTENRGYLYLALIAYVVMIFCLVIILKKGTLKVYTNNMWLIVGAILATISAFFLFKKHITNNIQWLGLILIVIGCFVISRYDVIKTD